MILNNSEEEYDDDILLPFDGPSDKDPDIPTLSLDDLDDEYGDSFSVFDDQEEDDDTGFEDESSLVQYGQNAHNDQGGDSDNDAQNGENGESVQYGHNVQGDDFGDIGSVFDKIGDSGEGGENGKEWSQSLKEQGVTTIHETLEAMTSGFHTDGESHIEDYGYDGELGIGGVTTVHMRYNPEKRLNSAEKVWAKKSHPAEQDRKHIAPLNNLIDDDKEVRQSQPSNPHHQISEEEYQEQVTNNPSTSTYYQIFDEKKREKYRYTKPVVVTTDHEGTPSDLKKKPPKDSLDAETAAETVELADPKDKVTLSDWYEKVTKVKEQQAMKRYGPEANKRVKDLFVDAPFATSVPAFTLSHLSGGIPINSNRKGMADRANLRYRRDESAMTEKEMEQLTINRPEKKLTGKALELSIGSKRGPNYTLDQVLDGLETAGGNAKHLKSRLDVAQSLILEQGVAPIIGESLAVRNAETMIWFLARFKWATKEILATVTKWRVRSVTRTMLTLASMGLVHFFTVPGLGRAWALTKAGVEFAELKGQKIIADPPRGLNDISVMMIAHDSIVKYVAANLIAGTNVNVLSLDEEWPQKNRLSIYNNKPRYGEEVVTETEIKSTLRRLDIDRNNFQERKISANYGGAGRQSDEFKPGNEFLYSILPPPELGKAWHNPDLIVARPRNEDGDPEAIAVEVELRKKPLPSMESILRSYKHDTSTVKKVVWLCNSPAVASQIEHISKMIGLYQSGRIDIVPLVNKDGVFNAGKASWMIGQH